MKKKHFWLIIISCLLCPILRAQNSGMTPLITDVRQLSSLFTDPEEGTDIGALIDDNIYTFWHSDWHSTPRADYHWIDVQFPEPVYGICYLSMYRRNSSNDHPTEFEVYGSTDGDEWHTIKTLSLPYQGITEVKSDTFHIAEEVNFLRLIATNCSPSFRTIWHAAELQIYQISTQTEFNTDFTDVKINEVQVANIDQYIDHSYNYGGWIELHNSSANSYCFEGAKIRHTDSDGMVEEHVLELMHGFLNPDEYVCLWFDHNSEDGVYGGDAHLQIPFKLDPEGGKIELLNPAGVVIDAVVYPSAISRCSYARIDNGHLWGWTAYPTPEDSNEGSQFAKERLPSPVIDTESTLFTTDFQFNVQIPQGMTLRYTTDGSAPTALHGVTSESGQFEVYETEVYRFVLVAEDYLPSPVVTRTFIKDENDLQLPVLCISTAPQNLYDEMIGVYTMGINGVSGNGQYNRCNWNMDWERPVNVEYLVRDDEGYSTVLSQEADFSIAGGWTRAYGGGNGWEMKSSFRLKSGKVFEGQNSFDYPFFADSKPYNKYKTLLVRNGGNDTYGRFFDPAIQEIVRRSGYYVDCQAWQPCHIFFNGRYLGMFNLRENNNKRYGESEYGIDDDAMDQFELNGTLGYQQKAGDRDAFWQWLTLTKELAADPTNESIWQEICNLVDIDEFCNYMALECYIGSNDWLTNSNNLKGFRSREDDGKFHLVLFDADQAFRVTNMLSQVYGLTYNNDSRYADNNGVSYLAEILVNMLTYAPFRKQFVNAFSIVDGSVFEPERCLAIIDEMEAYVRPALALEGETNLGELANSSASLRDYICNTSRRFNCKDYMKQILGLSSECGVTVESNTPEVRLLLDGQEVPTRKFDGTIYGPATITSKAPAGYAFKGWEVSSDEQPEKDILPFNSWWRYHTGSSCDGINWQNGTVHYDWEFGCAPFGYGNIGMNSSEADYNTLISYGDDSNDKFPTYYFCTEFYVDNLSDIDTYNLHYYVDDGAILYVNGAEVSRHLMKDSLASYSDYSTGYDLNSPYHGIVVIPAKLLHEGNNFIAAEVHNNSATSSDIYFEARIAKSARASNAYFVNEENFVIDETMNGASYSLTAIYEKLSTPTQVIEHGASPVRINEISAGNEIYINDYYKKKDWVELYNTTDEPIDVSGMYLSDKRNNPQKYQISAGESAASTIIPPYGKLLVWCDGEDPISQLHAPFKLSNADGAYITIQAQDGTWSDEVEYLEQDRWQTYGRYPDGGGHLTLFEKATIALPNIMTSYAYVTENTEQWGDSQMAITLELAKGWNWVSHNLQAEVHNSRFTGYAQALIGQAESYQKGSDNIWGGTLKAIQPAVGYKMQMDSKADVTLRGELFDVDTPVSVHQGWNWLGCPLYNATTIEVALEGYEPTEGDAIVGINAFATYEDGRWEGTLTSLMPGQAYLLRCNSAQTFYWNSLTSPTVYRARRYRAPEEEYDLESPWTVDMHAYPNVTSLIATLEINGQLADGCIVAAFSGDECRGVSQEVDGLLYMNIYGNGGESIDFMYMDASGNINALEEILELKPETIVGSRKTPFQLTQTSTDVQAAPSPDAPIVSTTYYRLNGVRVSQPTSGAYIEKTIYEDGYTSTKKVTKR